MRKEHNDFRSSKEWKDHRKHIADMQDSRDVVTDKRLLKGYQCHHMNLDKDHYTDLNDEDFICVNKNTHRFIHWLWTYYKKDPDIIKRIEGVMNTMSLINS